MFDVCFYEAFAEEADALRAYLPSSLAAFYTDKTIQESRHESPPARLISIRTQSQIPLTWASQLDAILSRSTGYDHLLAYAAQVNAPPAPGHTPPALGYLPLYCHRAVAEHAVFIWMALLRRLPRQLRQFVRFERDHLSGGECKGRTLAVVGVGHIGHEVCRLGAALGMKVIGVDLDPRYADVAYTTLEQALAQCDVLVCAMDLNRTNRGSFGMAQWRQIKPGAIFVNVSRGELSPSTSLLEALNAGLLGGVGLDVFNHEPELATTLRQQTTSTDPEVLAAITLSQRDDCLCTPHNAFNSIEAVDRKSDHSVQQIIAFREQGTFLWSPPNR